MVGRNPLEVGAVAVPARIEILLSTNGEPGTISTPGVAAANTARRQRAG